MVLLNINILIGILFLVLLLLTAIDATYDFKQLYPDLKHPKRNWARRVLVWIKAIITALIPIYNLAMCWVIMFKNEEIKSKALNELYLECVKETKKEK